jgi:hypothetical protein
MRLLDWLRNFRMRVAVTFRHQPEHERRDYEDGNPFFGGSEAEFLPHCIEFKTAAPFNQATPSKWL